MVMGLMLMVKTVIEVVLVLVLQVGVNDLPVLIGMGVMKLG